MKPPLLPKRIAFLCLALNVLAGPPAWGQGDDSLVGVWAYDEGFQIVELLFRSDGRYQLDKRGTDPNGS